MCTRSSCCAYLGLPKKCASALRMKASCFWTACGKTGNNKTKYATRTHDADDVSPVTKPQKQAYLIMQQRLLNWQQLLCFGTLCVLHQPPHPCCRCHHPQKCPPVVASRYMLPWQRARGRSKTCESAPAQKGMELLLSHRARYATTCVRWSLPQHAHTPSILTHTVSTGVFWSMATYACWSKM